MTADDFRWIRRHVYRGRHPLKYSVTSMSSVTAPLAFDRGEFQETQWNVSTSDSSDPTTVIAVLLMVSWIALPPLDPWEMSSQSPISSSGKAHATGRDSLQMAQVRGHVSAIWG